MKDRHFKTNLRNIFKSTFAVSVFSLLLRFFSMGKEIVFAVYFGVSDMLDAYLISVMIPVLISDIFSNGFSSSVMVNYSSIKNQSGRKKADEYFSNMIIVNFFFLSLLILILYSTIKYYIPLFTHNYPPFKKEFVQVFLIYLIPLCFLNGFNNLFKHYFYIYKKFTVPSLINIFTPLAIILFVLFAGKKLDVYSAVWGIISGSIFQFFVMYLFLLKNNFKLKFELKQIIPHFSTTTSNFLPLVIGASFSNLNLAVDNSMATMLPAGGVSILSYSSKIPALFNQLFAYSISTVLFPYFTNLYTDKNFSTLRKTFYYMIIISFLLGLFICLFVFYNSEFLINLLFNYGNFSADNNLAEVSKVMRAYCFHTLFLLCGMICVKIIISMGRNFIITFVGIQNFILNIYFNLRFLKYGPSGIAFSTTLVYMFSFGFLFIYTIIKLRENEKN